MPIVRRTSQRLAMLLAIATAGAATARPAAADLVWKGHTWKLTSGGMAGVCQGDPNNVSVDADGYLHLKISHAGAAWTASELFTTDSLGFGTYQWQVDGPIDTYDKNIVLGLFPYGPAAGIGADGTNEIDIEYSRWGQAGGPNGDWTDYPNTGKTVGELSYTFALDGTLSTSRFIWTSASIQSFLIGGLQPVGDTTGLIKTWTYAPPDAATNVPQRPMPLGMNLWCFDAPPSNGQPIEIVIRDFQFVPAGATTTTGGDAGATDAVGADADATDVEPADVATTGAAGSGGAAGAAGAAPTTGAAGGAGGGGTTGVAGASAGAAGAASVGGVAGAAGHGASASSSSACSFAGSRGAGLKALLLLIAASLWSSRRRRA